MDEELEKKIGKIVLSIFTGFLKVLSIYLAFPFIFTILFVLFWVPTFLVGLICIGIERITGIDTSSFRYNQLTIPVNGLVWLFENIFMILFNFLLKTKIGLSMLIMTILVISFFEFQKKKQA
jgi:hypothetical protein